MLPTVDGATTQVDHVVVSRYGIFVVETKDYGGWIFGDEFRTYPTELAAHLHDVRSAEDATQVFL